MGNRSRYVEQPTYPIYDIAGLDQSQARMDLGGRTIPVVGSSLTKRLAVRVIRNK